MNRQHICFVFVLYVSSIFFSIKLCVFNDLDFFDRYAYAVCVLPDDLSFFPFVRSPRIYENRVGMTPKNIAPNFVSRKRKKGIQIALRVCKSFDG